MINKLKIYYNDSYLNTGVQWHKEQISDMGYPLLYSYKKMNIAGNIFVYPFMFFVFCFIVLTNLMIFSIGLIIYTIRLMCLGIDKLFNMAFFKNTKIKEENKQEIKGHSPNN